MNKKDWLVGNMQIMMRYSYHYDDAGGPAALQDMLQELADNFWLPGIKTNTVSPESGNIVSPNCRP